MSFLGCLPSSCLEISFPVVMSMCFVITIRASETSTEIYSYNLTGFGGIGAFGSTGFFSLKTFRLTAADLPNN